MVLDQPYSDFIEETMRTRDPEGFNLRLPTVKVIPRNPLTAIGPNDEWSGDGHDKYVKYGLAIWGIRDKFSRYWLGLWVLPTNRVGRIICYLWLSTVQKYGGEYFTLLQLLLPSSQYDL